MSNSATRFILHNPVESILAVLMLAITVDVLAAVLFRYVLHMPLGFYDELARFLFIWVCFLGAVVAVRRKSHFEVALLKAKIPQHLHKPAALFVDTATLGFCLLLVKEGIAIVQLSARNISPAMEISMAYLYAVVPISGVLMILYLVPQMLAVIRGQD